MDMRTDVNAVPHAGLSEKTLGNRASKGKVKLEAIARSWRPSSKFGGQSTKFTASMFTASTFAASICAHPNSADWIGMHPVEQSGRAGPKGNRQINYQKGTTNRTRQ